MRRLVVGFLLLLLPLQFAWAAAVGYCDFEQDVSSHFGHHGHAKVTVPGDASPDKGTTSADCAICHLGCMQAQPSSDVRFGVPILRLSILDVKSPRPDHPQEPFDRPPRAALA